MRGMNSFIKRSCSLFRETTRVWLLQLCLPSLTGSGEIDGPRQFAASASHTLVEKHGVFWTTLLVGYDTLLVTVPSQLVPLHLNSTETGATRLLTASHLDLSLKNGLTFGRPQQQTHKYLWPFLTERDFVAALQQLKPDKAPGPDFIFPKLIIHAGAALKFWLRDFLSSFLRRLKIFKIWRRVLVVAIPKPMKPVGDPKNYRPISALCPVQNSREAYLPRIGH